jgi:transposase-like protein
MEAAGVPAPKPAGRLDTLAPKADACARKRHWAQEQKAKILAETFEEGAIIAEIPRRHHVKMTTLTDWRRKARGDGAGATTIEGLAPAVRQAMPPRLEMGLQAAKLPIAPVTAEIIRTVVDALTPAGNSQREF